jgi:hypothetical protein
MLIVLDILSFKTEHRRSIIACKSVMTMPWQRFCTYDGDSITLRKELFLVEIFLECLCSPLIGRRLEALVAPTNDSGDTEVNLLSSST